LGEKLKIDLPSKAAAARSVAVIGLQIAEGYAAAHIHEAGGNSRGDQVEFFQRLMGGAPGDPWCADFVCSCLVKAYARFHRLPEDRDRLPGYVGAAGALLQPLSGSCAAIARSARKLKLLRSPDYVPVPADLVLFDFEGLGKPHHIGIVRSASHSVIHTIEGNTSSGIAGSQADGDGVFYRSRLRSHVYGFVHFG
jgi:hypothetical protein